MTSWTTTPVAHCKSPWTFHATRLPSLCVTGAGLLLLCSCATNHPDPKIAGTQAVRTVDFTQAPGLEPLAAHARQFGDKMYPKVCALLLGETAKRPLQFDLVFKPLESGAAGETHPAARIININSVGLTNSAAARNEFDKVFIHEMAHMATQLQRWSLIPRNIAHHPVSHWGEGLADYAGYRLLGADRWGCPECNALSPHYASGYSCTCAFLLFLEQQQGTNFIRQLTAVLRRHHALDRFFVNSTGESLDVLWKEFQSTPAFRPGARESLRIQQALGFTPGQPPRDAVKRFNRYAAQHLEPATKRTFSLQYDPEHPPPIEVLIEIYLYNTQPGGPPEQTLLDLRDAGRLPGLARGEKGFPLSTPNYDELVSQSFPKSKTICFHREGDPSVYHYTMTRASLQTGWKLEKAWRTGQDGKTIGNYPVR